VVFSSFLRLQHERSVSLHPFWFIVHLSFLNEYATWVDYDHTTKGRKQGDYSIFKLHHYTRRFSRERAWNGLVFFIFLPLTSLANIEADVHFADGAAWRVGRKENGNMGSGAELDGGFWVASNMSKTVLAILFSFWLGVMMMITMMRMKVQTQQQSLIRVTRAHRVGFGGFGSTEYQDIHMMQIKPILKTILKHIIISNP
jgi:hypothetical protein